jgi:hypothetical protein
VLRSSTGVQELYSGTAYRSGTDVHGYWIGTGEQEYRSWTGVAQWYRGTRKVQWLYRVSGVVK